MTSKSGKAKRVKESTRQETREIIEPSACARVTVSLNPKLLKVVDRYANRHELSRSAVFEKALMKWCEALQEEADRQFYSAETQDPSVRNWNKVGSKAIRYLWDE